MVDSKFCSLESAKLFLAIGEEYAKYDQLLTEFIIPTSSKLIANFCRRQFDKAVYVEYFSTPFRQYESLFTGPAQSYTYDVYLKETPIDTVAAFDPRLSYISVWDASTVLTTDSYIYDAETGRLSLILNTYASSRALKVSYTGGYSKDNTTGIVSVPIDIKTACIIQSGFLLKRFVDSMEGVESSGAGSYAQKFTKLAAQGLLPEVMSMLSPYKKSLIGAVA